VTDALGHVTSYTYDALGNLTSETDALGHAVSYTYTPEGWLETVTDGSGHVTRYTYDRTGNVLTADYAGEQTETNTYNELGLLTTVTTAEGNTLYQYDQASRLISVTQPNGETVSYTYDSHGNRATMTYPNGKTVKYTYDEMNRLIAVKGIDGATTKYEYDALGRRIATDGVKEDTVYSYDAVGNLISQTTTGKINLSLEYIYDLAGRMTQESRTENGATLESMFTYDPLGQLTSFTRSDGQSETYTYDPVGNMTAKTKNGVQTAMRYNAANQLIQSTTGTDTTAYTYDANGNLVRSENAGGARSYAYNALGLLEQFTREDGYTESYRYNANRLLSEIRTSEGLTTALTWDILYGDGVVIAENQNGQTTNYTYGLERISALSGSTRTEYVYDGRGSVAAELSYNTAWYTVGGLIARKHVTSKSYTPFGEQIGEVASGFGYNGEYYSADTGMIYLRARFYAPEMNRFGKKDLLRGSVFAPQSLNRYLYVQNDPMNLIDPSGMSIKSLWEKGKEIVSGFVDNLVSDPIGTVVNAGRTVVNAVTHPVTTLRNFATTTGDIITELFTPDSKPQSNTPTALPSRGSGANIPAGSSSSGAGQNRQSSEETILYSAGANNTSARTGYSTISSLSPSVINPTSEFEACNNNNHYNCTQVYSGQVRITDNNADTLSGDKTKKELRKMKYISFLDLLRSETAHVNSWKELARTLSADDLQNVIIEMIDHFMDETGTDYRNSILSDAVINHETTQQYMTDFTAQFERLLQEYQGNMQDIGTDVAMSTFKEYLRDGNVYLSNYSYGGGVFDRDTYSGLTMAIHSWTKNDVYLVDFQSNGSSYSGTLHFEFIDVFGLDETDVGEFGVIQGFRSWYILQHYDQYSGNSPFNTVVGVDYHFEGTYGR